MLSYLIRDNIKLVKRGLIMSHEIETMAFNEKEGSVWHGLGKNIEGFMTMTEALEHGGLNWNVEKLPIYNANGEVINGHYATTRDSDNNVLGIVGERYRVLQNSQALSFLDVLVGQGQAVYDTVASLRDGRIIFAAVKIPDENIDANDPIEKYLLVTNSHDGSTPVQVIATDIRVVCSNTLRMAIKGSKNSFSVRHTTNLQSRVLEANSVFEKSLAYFRKSNEAIQIMKSIPFNEKQLQELVAKVYDFDCKIPDSSINLSLLDVIAKDDSNVTTRQSNILEEITELSYTGKGTEIIGVKGTAYGAYNAMTEYFDHYSTNRKHNNRPENDVKIDSIHFGSIAQKRQKTFDTISDMIQLPV